MGAEETDFPSEIFPQMPHKINCLGSTHEGMRTGTKLRYSSSQYQGEYIILEINKHFHIKSSYTGP